MIKVGWSKYSFSRFLAVLVLSTGMAGCLGDIRYTCLKQSPEVEQPLYVSSWNVWRRNKINVCWESDTFALHPQKYRDITRQAIEDTWNDALDFEPVPEEKRVRFVGWEECTPSTDDGVRISVPLNDDENPHVNGLGADLGGRKDGVVLNFTFENWSPSCATDEMARAYCISTIAIHEFGHALGFTHEQNRPDTNTESCQDEPQGSDGDVLMGPWDLESVLNYCNPNWSGGGVLSEGDILGARAAYYPELYDFECLEEFKVRHPIQK